jgi:hypothetical protein
MQAFIGATLLTSKEAQPQSKPFEIYDNRLSGFMLRLQPSGMRSYYARFGRNRRVVLGKVGTVTPEEARERCQKVLGNVVHGLHPLHGLGGTDGITLGMFIADTYTTWVNASRPRTAANTLEKLHRLFRTWYPEPLTTITVERIESWKARRLNEGRSGATVLRDLFTLSSVLRRAVKAGELTENPVRRVDKPRIDRRGKVRFLDQAEELRLRKAVKARDVEQRTCSEARRAPSVGGYSLTLPSYPALRLDRIGSHGISQSSSGGAVRASTPSHLGVLTRPRSRCGVLRRQLHLPCTYWRGPLEKVVLS